jgi:hypothetical protein
VSQRRVVVGIAGAVATLLLAACGFDSPAVTNHEKASIQAHDFSVGKIRVRNAYVTTVLDNSRGFSTSSPGTTYLVLSLVNQGTQSDSLTGITSPAGSVSLTGSGVFGGSLTVPPKGVPVVVNLPVSSPQGPTATFTAASTTTPQLGTFVPMQFSFSGAGTSSTEPVPVVPPTATTAATSPVPTDQATPPPQPGESAAD